LESFPRLHFEYFHHLIPQVVDDFDGDSALLELVEGAGDVAVEGFPGFGVDFCFEVGFEGAVAPSILESRQSMA
jgi:hypothetical protein